MKTLRRTLIVLAATCLVPVLASPPPPPHAKPSSYAPGKPNPSRIYGTPIQPPIVRKSRVPRKGAHAAPKPTEAQRKARAATAARKAKANQEYRRAHPSAPDASP